MEEALGSASAWRRCPGNGRHYFVHLTSGTRCWSLPQGVDSGQVKEFSAADSGSWETAARSPAQTSRNQNNCEAVARAHAASRVMPGAEPSIAPTPPFQPAMYLPPPLRRGYVRPPCTLHLWQRRALEGGSWANSPGARWGIGAHATRRAGRGTGGGGGRGGTLSLRAALIERACSWSSPSSNDIYWIHCSSGEQVWDCPAGWDEELDMVLYVARVAREGVRKAQEGQGEGEGERGFITRLLCSLGLLPVSPPILHILGTLEGESTVTQGKEHAEQGEEGEEGEEGVRQGDDADVDVDGVPLHAALLALCTSLYAFPSPSAWCASACAYDFSLLLLLTQVAIAPSATCPPATTCLAAAALGRIWADSAHAPMSQQVGMHRAIAPHVPCLLYAALGRLQECVTWDGESGTGSGRHAQEHEQEQDGPATPSRAPDIPVLAVDIELGHAWLSLICMLAVGACRVAPALAQDAGPGQGQGEGEGDKAQEGQEGQTCSMCLLCRFLADQSKDRPLPSPLQAASLLTLACLHVAAQAAVDPDHSVTPGTRQDGDGDGKADGPLGGVYCPWPWSWSCRCKDKGCGSSQPMSPPVSALSSSPFSLSTTLISCLNGVGLVGLLGEELEGEGEGDAEGHGHGHGQGREVWMCAPDGGDEEQRDTSAWIALCSPFLVRETGDAAPLAGGMHPPWPTYPLAMSALVPLACHGLATGGLAMYSTDRRTAVEVAHREAGAADPHSPLGRQWSALLDVVAHMPAAGQGTGGRAGEGEGEGKEQEEAEVEVDI